MTLREYQTSKGIETHEHILTINNPLFSKDFNKVICTNSILSKFYKSRIFSRFAFAHHKYEHIQIPEQNSLIFVGFEDKSMDKTEFLIYQLFPRLKQLSKFQYTLVLGKGDYIIDDHLLKQLPNNITALFANNVDVLDDRIHYFPMGRDFRSVEEFRQSNLQIDRSIHTYCNFSITTHRTRKQIYDMLKNKKFIEFDHMGKFKSYGISRKLFFEKLSKSQFSICPRGNAGDTFRLWDSLYLGTIPIVLKEFAFHKELTDLPILFLDNLHDFEKLSRKQLSDIYDRYLDYHWNYEKLKLSFWKKRISQYSCP